MAHLNKIDTIYKVETPEGVNLIFRPASPIIRSLALLCDILMQALILLILSLIFLVFFINSTYNYGRYIIGLLIIIVFIIYWWYFVLFEVLGNGQSIGKRIFRIRVIHDDGTPITWSASLLRNLLRAVDMLPAMLYGLGLTACLTSEGFKRLGDIAAGTLVVYLDPPSAIKPSQTAHTENPAPVSLSEEEQKTIVNFAERKNMLSNSRRLELASILAASFNQDSQVTEQMLYQIAQYITGADTQANSSSGKQ